MIGWNFIMLSVFIEMLGRWVVPFENYVRQFHPISKMATTGEHSLTWTLCEIISKIFSSEITRPIETKRSHNGPYVVPCKIVSDILTLHLRWRYCGHSLKLDFFLKFIFSGICNQSFWSLSTSIYYVVCKSVWKLGERYRVRFLILFHIYDPNIKVAYLVIKNKWNNAENRNSLLQVW